MKNHPFLKILLGSILMLLLALAVMAAQPRARANSSPAPLKAQAANSAAWPTIQIQLVADGFTRPVYLTQAGDGSGRLFVVEQDGLIRILHTDGSINPTPFLDISGRLRSPANGGGNEQGLLGLAFPPGYAQKGHFYVYYTNPDGNNRVARFSLSGDPDRADPASEEQILLLEHPGQENHNGGQIEFGADGYLYIGTGDGGGGGDPSGNAQNPASLLGKILRIDVEYVVPSPDYSTYLPCMQKSAGQGQDAAYRIPSDNPFVGQAGYREEIWALGMRNPWRFAFDRQTHDLYIADVGQNIVEEVDFQLASSPGGENYGWNVMEGSQCYNQSSCDSAGMTPPVTEYNHDLGCSITGGYVYRGAAYPALQGIYLYADFCSGKVWGLQNDGGWQFQHLLDSGMNVSSFGQGENGELYMLSLSGGVYQVTTGTP
jgi:glucose/arabinose dehydrogenase